MKYLQNVEVITLIFCFVQERVGPKCCVIYFQLVLMHLT